MEEIIKWLLGIERMAGQLYSGAVALFPKDRTLTAFLTHLADDESLHILAMGSAVGRLHSDIPLPKEAILLDEEIRDKVEIPFQLNLRKLQAGTLDRQSLLECILETEFSEWNDLFLYVLNHLKEGSREFQYVAARMHAHQKRIEDFLAKEPTVQDKLAQIRRLPRVWDEKILLVDDSAAIRELMEAILEDEALVETAADAREGLQKIRDNYYDLIISDVSMPGFSGFEFYEKAVELDPDITNRFLFYTGYLNGEDVQYLQRLQLPYLLKPARVSEIRQTVRTMLHGQRESRKYMVGEP